MTTITASPIGVSRTAGYPRAAVEPLLWLAFTSGMLWLAVALQAHNASPTGATPMLATVARDSWALGLVLVLNGLGALMMLPLSRSVARLQALLAGLSLAVSAWEITRMPEINDSLAVLLFWGSIGAGGLLILLMLLRWNPMQVTSNEHGGKRSWIVLGVLVVIGGFLTAMIYDLISTIGLVAVGEGSESAWDFIIPPMLLLTGVLAAIGPTWRREWGPAFGVLVISAVPFAIAVFGSITG
jgi:hypothetical protein